MMRRVTLILMPKHSAAIMNAAADAAVVRVRQFCVSTGLQPIVQLRATLFSCNVAPRWDPSAACR